MEAKIGLGDELLASGMARGAAARGKLAAFGDKRRIIWGPNAREVFVNNPNIASSGQERFPPTQKLLEWHDFYHGHRTYVKADVSKQRDFVWNYDFRAQPGELFFSEVEKRFANKIKEGFVLVEPNVPPNKSYSINKHWPVQRYQEVVNALVGGGVEVVQLEYPRAREHLSRVRAIPTLSSREAFAVLSRAALYIGPEGGMHHAAAALGISAVVIFGGFIPPSVTGYEGHINLTGGAEACGTRQLCQHCAQALDKISADEVLVHANNLLNKRRFDEAERQLDEAV